MQKLIFTTFASAMFAGSASAAVVLNPSFEAGNLNDWLSSSVDSAGFGSNPITNGFTASRVYLDGDVADLGADIAFANTNATRTQIMFTTAVFEDDATTPQLITEGDELGLTVALGNRTGGGTTNFRDSADATLTVGYLTTPGDLSTFVGISSTSYLADSQINTIGDDTFADFGTSTMIANGNAAIGNEFAIRVTFATPTTIPVGSTANRQSTLDYVRVAVPEPSSFALIGLGFAGAFLRRRR